MEEKTKPTGFLGNWIVKNILWAVGIFAALLIGATLFLNTITQHGRTVEVPDLTYVSAEEAYKIAKDAHLRAEVIDSIYIRKMGKGDVYSQNPKAGTQVKKGRRILLTINAVNPKMVSVPNLVGLSMRQAKAELNSRGLSIGRLIYVNDIATNNVIRQIYRNRTVKPGRQVETGSEIDLEVGLNPADNQTYVPNVRGMKYLRAVDAIHESSLNVRKMVFDETVKNYSDSINAAVVRQNPNPSNAPVIMGSDVTIYLSAGKDEDKN